MAFHCDLRRPDCVYNIYGCEACTTEDKTPTKIECLGSGKCEAVIGCEVAWCKRCCWSDEPGTPVNMAE